MFDGKQNVGVDLVSAGTAKVHKNAIVATRSGVSCSGKTTLYWRKDGRQRQKAHQPSSGQDWLEKSQIH